MMPATQPTRERKADDGSRLTKFARGSGIYRLQGGGHANLYQMFVERALSLLRRDGRLGLVLPVWLCLPIMAAPRCVATCSIRPPIDSFVVVENREGLFPIHRAVKFVLMTLTKSSASAAPDGTERLAAALRNPVGARVRRAARRPARILTRCASRAS